MPEYSLGSPENLPAQTKNVLTYQGMPIADRGEKLSLTDMWRAAGSPSGRAPADWRALTSTLEFSDHVATILNAGNSGNELFTVTRGGKAPGTWAHWQMGLAYAKYLNHDFHMWGNQAIREKMEQKAIASTHGLSGYDIKIIGNVVKNCAGVAIREQLAELLPQMLTSAVASIGSMVAPGVPSPMIRQGRTAGQIWNAHGFPRLRSTAWFGNRLTEMGCGIYGRGELGDNRARLFDPDKASDWIKGGGRRLIEGYVKERAGQGKLEGM